MVGHGNLSPHLPILDGKKWDKWVTIMKFVFAAESVCDMVENSLEAFSKDASEAQRKV